MHPQPPALFIHGFIGSFDVASFDLPHAAPHLLGYGDCRAVDAGRVSLPAQVEHLRAYIDTHMGGGPVDLVGHSVGGAIAMLLAHTHPGRVRRIVNVEGNFTLDDAFWSASVGRMSQDEAEAMLARLRACAPSRWPGCAEPLPRRLRTWPPPLPAGWTTRMPARCGPWDAPSSM
ncbi:alpha/beta fold hydrolase [Delftia acidovorans]|uniref:alpha/beta fold hydrolase n=1 Tax=Delftia acidovorans TaxID=80866 RepID=UPI0021A7F54A|nr:alpha/beta hydrolase [Delftia acidovorans]